MKRTSASCVCSIAMELAVSTFQAHTEPGTSCGRPGPRPPHGSHSFDSFQSLTMDRLTDSISIFRICTCICKHIYIYIHFVYHSV